MVCAELNKLSGVAAVLRFPLPEIEEDDRREKKTKKPSGLLCGVMFVWVVAVLFGLFGCSSVAEAFVVGIVLEMVAFCFRSLFACLTAIMSCHCMTSFFFYRFERQGRQQRGQGEDR